MKIENYSNKTQWVLLPIIGFNFKSKELVLGILCFAICIEFKPSNSRN